MFHMDAWSLISAAVLNICLVYSLKTPDYDSMWLPIASNTVGNDKIKVNHELGEIPLIVDVQVKSKDTPNEDYIFQAVGGRPRDDDEYKSYGGVLYAYNDTLIIVSAPAPNNSPEGGNAIYLAKNEFYDGYNSQTSDEVLVRIRAWKSTSVPMPSFQKTGIFVRARSSNFNEVYIEENHGLKEYPALVLVRTKLLDGLMVGVMSDAVGASMASYYNYPWTGNGYVIYGFNNQTVRVWIPSKATGYVHHGGDGYRIFTAAMTGSVEIYVWSYNVLRPNTVRTTSLGPNIVNEDFEIQIPKLQEDDFVRTWVESTSGINNGYRFLGSGALAYGTLTDPVCSYGGLTYGYGNNTMRFWRPTETTNAGIVCIGYAIGGDNVSDIQVDGKIVANVWATIKETTTIYTDTPVVQNTCTEHWKT